MKTIANIITDTKIEIEPWFNMITAEEIDENIPTLVIGWEKTKTLFPEANILDWKIGKNLYWSFGKRERHGRFDKTFAKFKTMAIDHFIKSQHYSFLSLLTASKEEKVKLIGLITNEAQKGVFIYNDVVYIASSGTDNIIGFSLRDVEYEGHDKKKIFSLLYSNSAVNMIDNKDVPFSLKSLFRNCIYSIPYLYI